MNTPRYAAAAAKLLAKHAPAAPHQLMARERSVATIERAVRTRARRRTLWLASASVAVAAAALVALVSGSRDDAAPGQVSISVATSGRGAAVRASGAAQRISTGAELFAGQRLETPADGGASLRLSTGTEMTLSGSTSFRVDSQGKSERFSLERGELVAHVAKLDRGSRFVVDTPDAQIEVRGTRFRLRVLDTAEACGSGTRTRLSVTEGLVEVRAAAGPSQRVAAGEHWPVDCAPRPERPLLTPPSVSSAAPDASAPSPRHVRGAAQPASRAASPPSPPPSAPWDDPSALLAAQNDLFARGVAMRRQGDATGALRAFHELIRRFPSSPLAENAMVERLRILVARGDASRTDEAERYLARYPRGFAVQEARRALAEK